MIHKSSLQSRIALLSIVAMALFFSTIAIAVAAQGPPSVTVTPDKEEVATGDNVKFSLAYALPEDYDFDVSADIEVTWTNASFDADATDGDTPDELDDTRAIWTYEDGLPDSNELPTFTLTSGAAPGLIDVTVTISSPTQPNDELRTITGSASVNVPEATADEATAVPQQPDLSTSTLVLDPPNAVTVGSPITITVIVSNTGSTAAEDVTVVFTPTSQINDLTLIELLVGTLRGPTETGRITISLRDVVPQDESMAVNLKGVVASDAGEKLGITALFTATGAISESLNVSVPVVPPARPTLTIELDGPTSAMTGDALSLILKVSNTGDVLAENVKVGVTTSPAVTLKVVDGGLVTSTQSGDNRLILEFPSIAAGEDTAVTLTGAAPDSSAPLLVDVTIQDSGPFDPQSTLAKNLSIPLTPPPPSATPEATATQPPPTAEPVPSSTPTPEAAPSRTSQPPEDGTRSLLVIGGVALLAAIVAGIVLFFLLRGRRKPSAPPPVAAEEPGPPVTPLPPSPAAGAVLESLSIPGRRLRLSDGTTTVGRAPDSTICINERYMNWETVSRRHAEIRREGDDYVIYDVSQRNGVYVEGRRTARNLLRSGWRVGIGGVEFIFYDAAKGNE